MWAEIEALVSAGIWRIVISGNPGIGKSRFALYVLYSLVTSDKCDTVVWEATRSRQRFLFRRGQQALEGGIDAFSDFLKDARVW